MAVTEDEGADMVGEVAAEEDLEEEEEGSEVVGKHFLSGLGILLQRPGVGEIHNTGVWVGILGSGMYFIYVRMDIEEEASSHFSRLVTRPRFFSLKQVLTTLSLSTFIAYEPISF